MEQQSPDRQRFEIEQSVKVGANLSGVNLAGVNLAAVNLKGANLNCADSVLKYDGRQMSVDDILAGLEAFGIGKEVPA